MIYSIIILILSSLLLLLLPVHSFYITNAAMLEQCSTGVTYLNKFDLTKMHCPTKTWRNVFFTLEYSCTDNVLKRIWTIKTSVNQGSNWPQEIFILTNTDYTQFDKTPSNKQDLVIEEVSKKFNSSYNQLITYMWTAISYGPQCRIKYTITKDICTPNKGQLGTRFTDFVCYYGKDTFNLIVPQQRQVLDKILDDSIRASSNTAQKNPSVNPNLSALTDNNNTFWNKNKRYILIVGGIGVVIIIMIMIIIIICCCRTSNKDSEKRMSVDSNVE